MPIRYCRTSTSIELNQILALQGKNMTHSLSPEEAQNEGFITVGHTFDILNEMHKACPHIIAKDGEELVGYALVMLRSFRNEIPVLQPMFDTADELLPKTNYVVMGQICIAKTHRRKGIFKGLYEFYRQELAFKFDCLFTEIATSNKRSLDAHMAVGFEVLRTQITDGVSWELVNWNWN